MAARLRSANSDGVGSVHFTTIEEIVACCVALDAEKAGGPLSVAEKQQIAWSAGLNLPVVCVDDVGRQILVGKDPLGDTLSAIRSPANRRAEGAIYTPPDIVSAMVSWILSQNPGTVVDPGCGSGRFTLEVARKAGERAGVIAIDSDPVGTLICRAGLSVLGATAQTVINGDYLTTEFPLAQSTAAFVGNPPYIRHHGISSQHKDWGRHAAAQLGVPWSGLAGMHVLFILATALRMRPGDVASFITSAEWLDVGYGKILRTMLANDPRLGSLHVLDPKASAFADAITTSVIVCLARGATNEEVLVRTLENVQDLTQLRQPGRSVPRQEFLSAARWTSLLTASPNGGNGISGLVPLGALVRVSRGVATGSNKYFVMRKEEAMARGLDDFVRPVVTSAEEVFQANGILRTRPNTKYILEVPQSLGDEARARPTLARYLSEGEKSGIPTSYLCRQRKFWWVLSPATPAIISTYMARRPPAFALNEDGLAILNVCHGLYPRVPLTQAQLKGLVNYLNALGTQLNGAGRTYQGGLQKFEPREMEAILVPPPDRLEAYADRT